MGILRAEELASLRRVDRHVRLRLPSPVVLDESGSHAIAIHSKVLVIDDSLAKIGSANFIARSMGVDTGCDRAVETYHPG